MHKRDLSKAGIKAKFITPAILKSGWDELTQLGREIYFHDKTTTVGQIEKILSLEKISSPEILWEKYMKYKGIETCEVVEIASKDYYQDDSGRSPR